MKQPTLYVRKGNKICDFVAGGKVTTYPSISAAKRESLRLQLDNGGRGTGCVRVARGKQTFNSFVGN